MAGARKDHKGRVLLKGESYREAEKRYQYAYIDSSGKKKYIYSKDLIKLRKREEQLLRDRMEGIDSAKAKKQTLNNMFDKYMSTRHDLTERTRAGYMYQYDAYVRDTIGRRKINDIKYSDVLVFYLNLMEEFELSFGTIERMQRELYPTFEMAVRDNIIRNNPAHNVLRQLKRQSGAERGIRKALLVEQQTSFINFLDGHIVYDHWKPIFIILLGTGLRVGELCALRWEYIDFESRMITIDHALIYFAGKKNKSGQRLFISKPKTQAGVRKVPMVDEVVKAFYEIKDYQQCNDLVCKSEIDGYTNFVFLNRFGNVFVQYNLDRALERIIKAHNEYAMKTDKKNSVQVILPHFTCHSLRHTFCARLCEHETNIKVIQSIMGHVDIETTMNIYAEVSEEKKKASLDRLASNLHLF